MELVTYKTNIKTESGLTRLATHLNPVIGSCSWQVDMSARRKILTVYSPGFVDQAGIKNAFRKAGYRAVVLENILVVG